MNLTDIAELFGLFLMCWAFGVIAGAKLHLVVAFFRGAGDV